MDQRVKQEKEERIGETRPRGMQWRRIFYQTALLLPLPLTFLILSWQVSFVFVFAPVFNIVFVFAPCVFVSSSPSLFSSSLDVWFFFLSLSLFSSFHGTVIMIFKMNLALVFLSCLIIAASSNSTSYNSSATRISNRPPPRLKSSNKS